MQNKPFAPLILLMFQVFLFACARSPEYSTHGDLGNETVRSYTIQANSMATDWHADAQLIEIKQSIDGRAQSSLEITFTYESHSVDDKQLSVVCLTGNCRETEYEVPFTWLSYGWLPLEFEAEMLDSQEALNIGIQNGGDNFLGSSTSIVWVRFGRDEPRDVGQEVWLAFFSDITNPSELRVVINPYTGAVLRIEG